MNESVISMFFMVVRYCLEVELEPEVERPLERIAQSVARTFFGVPVFEGRNDEQIRAGQ